jgi:hypothetical protein
MFTENFDTYVCDGDSITCVVDGYELTATIMHDSHHDIDDDDCHNTDQNVTGCNDEQQEKLLAARDAWFNNEWFYCGVVLSASYNGIDINEHAESLWGIEVNYPGTDNKYLTEVANELIDQGMPYIKGARAQMIETLTN